SAAAPEAIVLWEAQFGDFVNGAQIVIDQFISAGLSKWGETSRLTLLLPHGYEGNGPEHSSARLERFLQLAAQENIRIVNATTSGQYFHLLRRQALDPNARPLVVMTPKGLLRLKEAASSLAELAGGGFAPVLDDPAPEHGRLALDPASARGGCWRPASSLRRSTLARQPQRGVSDGAPARAGTHRARSPVQVGRVPSAAACGFSGLLLSRDAARAFSP